MLVAPELLGAVVEGQLAGFGSGLVLGRGPLAGAGLPPPPLSGLPGSLLSGLLPGSLLSESCERGRRPLAGAGLLSLLAMAQCSASRSSASTASSLPQKARTRGAILRHPR
jgi:hypothetical protein